jgi:hypothetical protein
LTILGLCLALGCGRGAKPKPQVDDVPAALKQAGAELRLDDKRPGKPIVAVYFVKCPLNDDTIELLRRLPNLSTVSFRDCTEPPESRLKEVATIANLRKLYLSGCTWVTDADLKEVANLRSLSELVLNGCERVTDSGVKELAPLQRLQWLELGECRQLTDAGLKPLAGLKQLRRLGLSGCDKITDAGEADLKTALTRCAITREQYDYTRTGVRTEGKE